MRLQTIWVVLAASGAGVHGTDAVSTEWALRQYVDQLTDERSCQVKAKDGDASPVFVARQNGESFVFISGADFPSRPVQIRVDKNRALEAEGDFSPAQVAAVIKQVRGGGAQILTKSYQWPNDYPLVEEFSTTGLTAQMDECRRWVRSTESAAGSE